MTLTLTSGERPTIECGESTETVFWKVRVDSLVIVAEYTTPSGPYGDDYFLVFGHRDQRRCLFSTASFYALGRDVVLAGLSELLHEELRFGLCDSTEWRSRVMWPKELADKEFLTFSEVSPQSIGQELRKLLTGPKYECVMSSEVKAYLGQFDAG